LEIYQHFVENGPIELVLVTKLSDQERDRYAFAPVEHRYKLEEVLQKFPAFESKIDLRGYRDRLHARFIFLQGPGVEERLFYLDRGLDILDPRTGLARGGPILEFDQPDPSLKDVFLET
jgi:hypothetical protein